MKSVRGLPIDREFELTHIQAERSADLIQPLNVVHAVRQVGTDGPYRTGNIGSQRTEEDLRLGRGVVRLIPLPRPVPIGHEEMVWLMPGHDLYIARYWDPLNDPHRRYLALDD